MNRIAPLIVVFALVTGCASTTVIRSEPSGAAVKDRHGRVVGKTPYVYSDTEMVNHTERFTVEMPGYERQEVVARRDRANVGNIIAFGVPGIIIWPLLPGLLWSWEYEDQYSVQLERTRHSGRSRAP